MSAQAAVAARNAPRVIPPPSPFGELLRRSKFAAFDPEIRQTYTAPASYIHRGNWGLKRPIANRNRDTTIVLRKFEEHAQYIEWDRADGQAKLIKRVEEQNIAPDLVMFSPWYYGLGQAANTKQSGLDSDFCPGESSEVQRLRDERVADDKGSVPLKLQPLPSLSGSESSASTSSVLSINGTKQINFDNLGRRGPGQYGSKSAMPREDRREEESFLQPNIRAMTPLQFRRYVEKLRTLRPAFLEYTRTRLAEDREKNRKVMSTIDVNDLADEELVHVLGLEARKKNLHVGFLGRYTEEHVYKEEVEEEEDPEAAAELANTPQPIKKQPHKLGGLMYAAPSQMETFFYSKPAPGFVLQDITPVAGAHSHTSGTEKDVIAAFAGLTVHLPSRDSQGALPLYEPSTSDGLNVDRIPDPSGSGSEIIDTSKSEREMRLIDLKVDQVPRVVGSGVHSYSLGFTKLRGTVATKNVGANFRTNPEPIGSIAYNGMMPPQTKSSNIYGSGAPSTFSSRSFPLFKKPSPQPSIKGALPTDSAVQQNKSEFLDALMSMVRKKPGSGSSEQS
ncbi:hypothetical protein CPC08DRAFT_710634 [Agrocybe pediades]|nr:hypothetical protein CPC08DRAFT_710634 [Agrocybe pediades]